MILQPLHQLRKLGDVGRDAPRFVSGHQIGRRSAPWFFLVIHLRERVAVPVLHDEARIVVVVDGPGRREAAGAGWHVARLVACMRRAPRADIYYIDAFTIRASDVRDDVPLTH